jgi:hypothetical protein
MRYIHTNVGGAQIVQYLVAIDDDTTREHFIRSLLPSSKVSMYLYAYVYMTRADFLTYLNAKNKKPNR